jgi:hypothetical protein
MPISILSVGCIQPPAPYIMEDESHTGGSQAPWESEKGWPSRKERGNDE